VNAVTVGDWVRRHGAASKVLVLNGPNLARLGSREPEVYGSASYADLVTACEHAGADLGLTVEVRQTDDEAQLVHWLHEAADSAVPVVLNPAAFTHYSYALRDACAQLTAPLVEVHLTNPAAREEFRHTSVVAGVATGTITGFGLDSFRLALRALVG
jgi:3-dehydroquinate dehydratase II